MTDLREKLSEALKGAARGNDKVAASTLRLIQAAVRERDACARLAGRAEGTSDAELTDMLRAMVEQRRDGIRHYEESGQLTIAEAEAAEIAVIERFLPPVLHDGELAAAIDRAIAEIGAQNLKDTGPVIALLKERYPGGMDVAQVRRLLRDRLG